MPNASSTSHTSRVAADEPAERAARRHRPDEHAGIERDGFHANAVAEQRAAGERRRRIDGDDADRQARRRDSAREPRRERALPRARRAGDADAPRAAESRVQRASSASKPWPMVLDDADGARERGLLPRVEVGEQRRVRDRSAGARVIVAAPSAARVRRARRGCRRRAPRADPRASRARRLCRRRPARSRDAAAREACGRVARCTARSSAPMRDRPERWRHARRAP